MDFHSMKRKELQALCKKRKIPANLSNLEMAKRLTEFTKENEKSLAGGGRKTVQGENVSETESTNVVMNKRVKKVRFSPEQEFIEFTRSVQFKRRSRRNSVPSGNSTLSVENVGSGEMSNEIVDSPCKVTGARGSKLVEVSVNEKRGRKGVKRSNQNTNGAATESLNNSELRNVGVDNPGRVTRLRGKAIVEAVVDASNKGTKRAKNDDKRGKKALDKVDDDNLIEEIVDIPVRLTRSRNQKLTEASSKEMREGKVEKNNDNVAFANAVNDDNGVVTTRSTRNRRVVNEGKSVKGNERGSDDKKIGEVHVMAEPQILLRRSKRKVNGVADSEILNGNTGKHESRATKGFRKTSMPLTVEGSRVDEESSESKIDPHRKLEVVLQPEEPIKLKPRRSNRRSTMPIAELKTENEDRCVFRSLVMQSEIAGGTCKYKEKVLQPARITRRSRRKTSVLKVVSADEKLDTVAVVDNFETSKHVSKPGTVEKGSPSMKTNARRSRRNVSNYESLEVIDESGVDSIVQQKSEAHRRKRIKSNNDPTSPIQSTRESSRSQKATPRDAIDSIATKRKPPSSLKEQHSLDASSCEGLLENGESLFVDYQLAVSATIINPVSISNSCAENITSEVGLTSTKRTHRKKQPCSISDSVVTADMKLINANELVNPEETAQSRTAELKMDIDCRNEISASKLGYVEKVNSLLEFNVHEETEENISDADKSEPEALVFSQTEDSNFHNKIDTKVLSEGLNVHENADFAETSSLADGVLLGHQIASKNDLDVTEDEGDKHIRPSLQAINRIGKVDGVFVQKNLKSVEPGHTNEIGWSIACDHKDEISEQTNEDTVPKAGEADVLIRSTDEKSELQLKEPLSGKLSKSLEGDKIDGDRGIDSELAETDEDGWLKDQKSADKDSELNLCYLFDEDRSARNITQHRRFFSGEYSVMDSDEQGISENSLAVSPTSICPNSTEVQLKRGVEADHTAKTDERPLGNSIQPESGETDESGSSKDQKRKCDEDEEFGVYNLFVEDIAISSDDNVVKDSDEQGKFHDFPNVAPIHSSEIMLRGDKEASQIAEGEETSVNKNVNPESAESSEDGCLQDQKGSKDEHWDFNISDLFDSGKSARMTPRDSEVGLTSTKRTLRKKQHNSILDSAVTANTKLINANELVNLEETALSRTAELKMDLDCRKEISASKLGDVEKVKSLMEFDVHDETEENILVADKSEPEALVFSQTEDSNFHYKLDTKVLPEGSNVHENAGFAETSALADSVLLGHQIVSKNDLDVTEDGDKNIQPSLHSINHIGKVEGVFVQKNLNSKSVDPGHTNEVGLSIACDPKDEISQQNNEHTVSKASESDIHIHSTDEKSEVQLKEPSSVKIRRSHEGDKIDGDRGTDSELAETDEGGWLKDHKSTDEDSEFNLSYLFDEERSARIIPQHRRFFSGEYSVMNSDEQGISKDSLAVSPISICPNSTELELKRGVEAHHTTKTNESPLGNSIPPESGETDGSRSSKDQKRKCYEDEEFGVYNLFVEEDRVISSDENVIKDSNEQEIFHDFPNVAPIHSSDILLMGDQEASQIAEGEETSVHKNMNPESAESSEGGCLQDEKGSKDEHWDFNICDLFDSGKSAGMTTRDRGMFSAEYSTKGSDEQGTFHDSPAVSTMSANTTEVNICTVSSNLRERVPSEPNSVSKSQGIVPATFGMCRTTENEDTDQEKEATNSQSKRPRDEMSVERTVRDEEHESFNQGDDHTNRHTHESAVQRNSSFSTPTAMENTTIQGEETWSGGSETAGNAMSILKINVKGKASEMVEGDEMSMGRTIRAEEYENFYEGDEHTNKYEPAVQPKSSFSSPTAMKNGIQGQEACSGGSETSGNAMSILWINDKRKATEMVEGDEVSRNEMSMGRTIRAEEHENFNQDDEHTNIDTYEPAEQPKNPLFAPTAIANTIEGQETWSCGTKTNDKGKASEMVEGFDNLENANDPSCGKDKEDFDDARISDVAIYMDSSKVWAESYSRDLLVTNIVPDASVEPTNVESSKSWTENDLKLLFATPTKVLATCNDDRTLENAVVCKSREKMGEIGSELENSLCLVNSLPDNVGDMAGGELNVIQNVEYDGCKAIEEQWTENKCESVRKNNFLTEDSKDENCSVGQSLSNEATCDGNETMEKDICSAGLVSSLGKVGGCHDMLVDTDLLGELGCGSEGKMAQRPDAEIRISDNADFQKSNAPENIHLFTACYEDANITREVLIDTCDVPVDPEIVKIGSFRGTPSGTFLKASQSDNEVTGWKHEKSTIKDDDSYSAKVCDNTDDNLRSSHEILDEEVDNVVPPAEHASSTFSSMGMHLLLGDNRGDDIEKSEAETPFFNLEEKIVNLNNDVSAVPDEPDSGCNEILKESDVEDTIKQYIDSEASVSLEFEESDVLTHIEEKTNTENADLVVNEGCSADVDEKPLVVETEGKELEEAKKNLRTILIHATPKKLLATADMKENAPRNKNSHVGDFTTMRLAKRRALQDVHWK